MKSNNKTMGMGNVYLENSFMSFFGKWNTGQTTF